jgi:hypothetical protein
MLVSGKIEQSAAKYADAYMEEEKTKMDFFSYNDHHKSMRKATTINMN